MYSGISHDNFRITLLKNVYQSSKIKYVCILFEESKTLTKAVASNIPRSWKNFLLNMVDNSASDHERITITMQGQLQENLTVISPFKRRGCNLWEKNVYSCPNNNFKIHQPFWISAWLKNCDLRHLSFMLEM